MVKEELLRHANGRWGEILRALAPQLIPAIEKAGRHVPCPVHGGRDGFRLFRDYEQTGGSICNTCGANPTGIATLMWVNGWRYGEAIRAISDYLHAGFSWPAAQKKDKPRVDDDERVKNTLNRVWSETVAISDPLAEPARRYFARRGIDIPPPEALRFHPSLPYYDGDRKVGEFPAIIAMVTGADGRPVTIHRTYLTKDGEKAPVESPKKLMPYPSDRTIVGGGIRLVEAGPVMAIAEGLETSLAVLEVTGLPVWCAVNAYLLERFEPPAVVRRVLVFADKDRPSPQHPGGHGQEAARRLIKRLWANGIRASVFLPTGEIPAGQKSLDWLDVLNTSGRKGFPAMRLAA